MNDNLRDEVQARRDEVEAELAELDAALSAMGPEHVGDVKNAVPPEGVEPGPEHAEPPAGSPASADDIAAARSAPPVVAQADPGPDGAPEPPSPGDGDTAGADGPSEPPHGTPAEPSDIAAARMAPPAPVVVPPSQ